MRDRYFSTRGVLASLLTLAFTLPIAADSTLSRPLDNAGPVFGIATGPGQQLVADAGVASSGSVI